jgi:hypothetical protein
MTICRLARLASLGSLGLDDKHVKATELWQHELQERKCAASLASLRSARSGQHELQERKCAASLASLRSARSAWTTSMSRLQNCGSMFASLEPMLPDNPKHIAKHQADNRQVKHHMLQELVYKPHLGR